MSSRNRPGEFGAEVGPERRDLLGRLRRMAVTLTSSAIWQVAGHVLLDKTRETRKAEVFSGIGIYARPPSSGGTPEAVVVFPGGPEQAIVAATRDETTRRAVFKAAGELAPGETAIYATATGAVVIIKTNGTLELRSAANPLVQSTILATTYRAAEDTLLTALSTYIAGIKPVADPTNVLTPPMLAAISAFQAAAASYLTTVVKVQ